MREYPNIVIDSAKDVAEVLRQITRIRTEDVSEIDSLSNTAINKIHTYEAVSSNTNIGKQNIVLVNSATASRTVTLPAASKKRGQIFFIKKADGSTLSVITEVESAGTIDNSTRNTLSTPYGCRHVFSDGAEYWTL